jgi:hypothetical protein
MSPKRARKGALVLALAWGGRAAAAETPAAVEAAVVHVSFDFGKDTTVPPLCRNKAGEVAQALAQKLSAHENFKYWDFQAGPAPAGQPALRFVLAPGPGMNLKAEIHKVGGAVEGHLSAELFSPSYIRVHGLPACSQYAAPVGKVLEKEWLQLPGLTSFQEKLQAAAPLGRAISTDDPPSRAVLPLPWDRYQRIATASFLITCKGPEGMPIRLQSQGLGRCRPYPAQPPFQAILVRHRKLSEGGDAWVEVTDRDPRLKGLEVVYFFLAKPNLDLPPDQCADSGAPRPQLAP